MPRSSLVTIVPPPGAPNAPSTPVCVSPVVVEYAGGVTAVTVAPANESVSASSYVPTLPPVFVTSTVYVSVYSSGAPVGAGVPAVFATAMCDAVGTTTHAGPEGGQAGGGVPV